MQTVCIFIKMASADISYDVWAISLQRSYCAVTKLKLLPVPAVRTWQKAGTSANRNYESVPPVWKPVKS